MLDTCMHGVVLHTPQCLPDTLELLLSDVRHPTVRARLLSWIIAALDHRRVLCHSCLRFLPQQRVTRSTFIRTRVAFILFMLFLWLPVAVVYMPLYLVYHTTWRIVRWCKRRSRARRGARVSATRTAWIDPPVKPAGGQPRAAADAAAGGPSVNLRSDPPAEVQMAQLHIQVPEVQWPSLASGAAAGGDGAGDIASSSEPTMNGQRMSSPGLHYDHQSDPSPAIVSLQAPHARVVISGPTTGVVGALPAAPLSSHAVVSSSAITSHDQQRRIPPAVTIAASPDPPYPGTAGYRRPPLSARGAVRQPVLIKSGSMPVLGAALLAANSPRSHPSGHGFLPASHVRGSTPIPAPATGPSRPRTTPAAAAGATARGQPSWARAVRPTFTTVDLQQPWRNDCSVRSLLKWSREDITKQFSERDSDVLVSRIAGMHSAIVRLTQAHDRSAAPKPRGGVVNDAGLDDSGGAPPPGVMRGGSMVWRRTATASSAVAGTDAGGAVRMGSTDTMLAADHTSTEEEDDLYDDITGADQQRADMATAYSPRSTPRDGSNRSAGVQHHGVVFDGEFTPRQGAHMTPQQRLQSGRWRDDARSSPTKSRAAAAAVTASRGGGDGADGQSDQHHTAVQHSRPHLPGPAEVLGHRRYKAKYSLKRHLHKVAKGQAQSAKRGVNTADTDTGSGAAGAPAGSAAP